MRVRASSDAPTRTRIERATWATTSTLPTPNLRPIKAVPGRLTALSFSAGVTSIRVPRSAGARPERIPVSKAMAIVNPRILKSGRTLISKGKYQFEERKAAKELAPR